MCWLLPHIPGWQAREVNRFSADRAQEVDVIVWNEGCAGGIPGFGNAVLVECKNVQYPVDSSDVAWFDWKMRLGGVSEGILVAANGITSDRTRQGHAVGILTAAISDNPRRRICVVTLDELAALGSTDDLKNLIIKRLMGLAARNPLPQA